MHANIWKTLKDQRIEHKYIKFLRNIYERNTACIQLKKKEDRSKKL